MEKLKTLQDRFYVIILFLIILSGFVGLPFTLSQLVERVSILNQGRIGLFKSPITYKSEIRGVFIHCAIFAYRHNWTIIAETLANYGIDSVYVELVTTGAGTPFQYGKSEWAAAINAFHSHGIEFHVVWNTVGEISLGAEYAPVRSNGTKYTYWNCPIKIKPIIQQFINQILDEFPEIDGIMLDYTRYAGCDMCYCDECRAAFDQWYYEKYGQHVTNWTRFYPEGEDWIVYANWRNEPINDLVKIIHDTAKARKPNIVISAAVWTYFSDCPIYHRKFIGQDTGRWIKEGWLDFVAPMMYTNVIYGERGETLQSFIDANLKYMTGGAEGKIPLIFLTGLCTGSPQNFSEQVNYARSRGLDGWIFWRYGGPGVESGGYLPDITPYLEAVTMPNTFKLGDIKVSTSETEATITWTTTLPATSRIEYNNTPLFTATWETWGDFPYWRINHIQGNISEDLTYTINHSITLTGLNPKTQYYFRIQGDGPGGNATSETLTFTTK
jgi:hypothetical protein